MERLRVARYLAKLPFVQPPVIENGTDPISLIPVGNEASSSEVP